MQIYKIFSLRAKKAKTLTFDCQVSEHQVELLEKIK